MKIRFPVAVALLSLALVACGDFADDASSTAPPPLPTKPVSASPYANIKVAHILIGKDGKGSRAPKVTRTKAEAYALAKSILNDVKNGLDFLDRAAKFSEDVGPDNKPNSNCGEPGVYAGTDVPGYDPAKGAQGARIEGFDEAWRAAALATPVGTVAPEPVESDRFGYFLIKRLK